MTRLPFTQDEYRQRWSAAYGEMRRRGFESAVVWGRGGGSYERFQEIFYLTNYYSPNSGYAYDWMLKGTRVAAHCAVILTLDREPLLIADFPKVDPALVATSRVMGGTDVVATLAQALRAEGIRGRTALVGSDCLSIAHFKALETLAPGVEWDPQEDLIVDIRVIKSAAELDVFRYAGETVSNGLTALFKALLSGASAGEAAGAAAKEVYRRHGHVHSCHISHGTWTADWFTDNPIAGYSTTTPATGDIVRGWLYGPMYQGYWLDPGRTTVIGLRPTVEQRRLVESCAGMVEEMRAQIRPGVRVHDIALLGQRLRREFGGPLEALEAEFPAYGHGSGLFWDPPVISTCYDGKHDTFKENMVASTEAFLATPGVGGVGFEQNFIVTNDGTELLTTTPMIWW
jgi:Xaa-Pro aminopeptidase